MKRLISLILGLSLSLSTYGAVFNQFAPATGILKGNSSSYITTAAVWADLSTLLTGTCNNTVFVRGDGSCNLVNLTSNVSGILPVANGGTATATPSLVAGTNVSITGTWPNQTINSSSGASFANPTGVIGLTAVNGVATTSPRSDSSPALSQSIVPTWTGAHTFTQPVTLTSGTTTQLRLVNTNNAANDTSYNYQAESGGNFSLNVCNDIWTDCNGFISGSRSGTDINSVSLQANLAGAAQGTIQPSADGTTGAVAITVGSPDTTKTGLFTVTANNAQSIIEATSDQILLESSDVENIFDVDSSTGPFIQNTNAGTSAAALVTLANDSGNSLQQAISSSNFLGSLGTSQFSGEMAIIGTANSAPVPLSIQTNGTERIAISGNGEFVGVTAPLIGTAVSTATSVRDGGTVNFDSNQPGLQLYDANASSNEKVWALEAIGTVLNWNACTDAFSCSIFQQVTRSGATVTNIGLNATAVSINSEDITPSTGSGNVASTTGCTTSPTPTYSYTKIGKLVALAIFSFNCTSNATSFTLTGLPASIRPPSLAAVSAIATGLDNSVYAAAGAYVDSTGVLTFYRNGSATGWTNSGVKGLSGTAQFTYQLQ